MAVKEITDARKNLLLNTSVNKKDDYLCRLQ